MSTRCQVHVVQEGMGWQQRVTLYHHCDGYPEGMLPLFVEAFERFGKSWRAGRAGHVASYLCAIDPDGFEPEDHHEFHDDIEYYYKLRVLNPEGGHVGERPRWIVSIWEPHTEGTCDNPGECLLEKPVMEIEEAWKDKRD